MSDLMRPTFERVVRLPPEQAAARLQRLYEDSPGSFVGQSVRSHLLITVGPDARHFWSPWLHVDVRPVPEAEGATHLFARFSPAPSIWTAYMLAYIALFTIALFSGFWAFSQWMVDQPPTLLWGVAIPVVIAAAMLWSARIGQTLARAQMQQLHDAVLGALEADGAAAAGPDRPLWRSRREPGG